MQCPSCGADNSDSAPFCTLCLHRFVVEPARAVGLSPDGAAVVGVGADPFLQARCEEQEMWRARRRRAEGEAASAVAGAVAAEPVAAPVSTDAMWTTVTEVDLASIEAQERRRFLRAAAVSAGVMAVAAVTAAGILYGHDWGPMTTAIPTNVKEYRSVVGATMGPAIRVWIEVMLVLFASSALAGALGGRMAGRFAAGFAPALAVAGGVCLLLLPPLSRMGSDIPVGGVFVVAVILFFVAVAIGTGAGASLGSRLPKNG